MIGFYSVDEKTPNYGQELIVITSEGKVKHPVFFSTGVSGKEKNFIAYPNDITNVAFWMPMEVAV